MRAKHRNHPKVAYTPRNGGGSYHLRACTPLAILIPISFDGKYTSSVRTMNGVRLGFYSQLNFQAFMADILIGEIVKAWGEMLQLLTSSIFYSL